MNDVVEHLQSVARRDERAFVVCDLGRMGYAEAWQLQQDLQQALIAAKRGLIDVRLPNFLLTVEHPPVYTLGKSGDESNLLVSESDLAQQGASFFHTDRGGDVTFHGPGQLVGYPIVDLDRFFTDIGRYLRLLEQVIIDVCSSYNLAAGRVAGRTGVWIDVDSGTERKICAFGIRCSRWVTMHGFAFNMNTDLGFYNNIIPCGIADRAVTSLAKELGHDVDVEECRARVVSTFVQSFGGSHLDINASSLGQLLAELQTETGASHD